MSEPTPFFRADALYVSWRSRKALNMLAKAMELPCGDALAETWINERLEKEHPDVVEFLNQRVMAEGEFKIALATKLKPNKPQPTVEP
jgi:hypothetical protein